MFASTRWSPSVRKACRVARRTASVMYPRRVNALPSQYPSLHSCRGPRLIAEIEIFPASSPLETHQIRNRSSVEVRLSFSSRSNARSSSESVKASTPRGIGSQRSKCRRFCSRRTLKASRSRGRGGQRTTNSPHSVALVLRGRSDRLERCILADSARIGMVYHNPLWTAKVTLRTFLARCALAN